MSRSFRKNVIATDGQGRSKSRKWRRTKSNQKLRRKLNNYNYEIADGCSYKTSVHSINSWDICDWKFRLEKPLNDKLICGKYITTKEELEKHYNEIKRK